MLAASPGGTTEGGGLGTHPLPPDPTVRGVIAPTAGCRQSGADPERVLFCFVVLFFQEIVLGSSHSALKGKVL